jgi:hypothetical protein
MFIPGPDPVIIFFIPDPGSGSEHFSSRINYIKRGMKSKNYLFSCFLWFQEEVFKVKKITHPGSGSRIQGVKKHRIPDPQHCVQVLYVLSSVADSNPVGSRPSWSDPDV